MKTIDHNAITAKFFPLGDGRYVLNADADGTARTLTCVHYCSSHITHPKGGFVEMGVPETINDGDTDLRPTRTE